LKSLYNIRIELCQALVHIQAFLDNRPVFSYTPAGFRPYPGRKAVFYEKYVVI
jgi:hypothetical protein